MPFSPRFTITNSITAALTKIERARGFLEAAKLSDDWIAEMRDRALVLEAHHTNRIEGTEITLEQTEKVLHGESVPGVSPDAQREVLNYREAFELVAEYLGSGDPITEGLIREIHKRLVRGVRGDEGVPGEYRRIQNYVVNSVTRETIYTPPPAHEAPQLMTEFVEWLQEESDTTPVLVAGIAQFQLVHIHPFVDGNGRAARLLSTLCLYRTGYDFRQLFTISEYYDRDRMAYYRALQGVREREMDLTGWLEYFTGGLAAQLLEVQNRGEEVIRHDVLLSKARKDGLKQRVLDIYSFLLKQRKASAADVEAKAGVNANRRTLQRDLRLLVEKRYVREVASSPTDPTKYYEPV